MVFFRISWIMQLFGIGTFSNNLSYLGLLIDDNIFVRALAITVPILIFTICIVFVISIVKYKFKEKEYVKKLSILLVYTIATSTVIIPISDKIHFTIGAMCRNFNNNIFYIYGIKKGS